VHAAMRERISQADLEQARAKAAKELEYAALSPPIREAVAKLCRQAVIPNVVYDRTATEEKRRQAMDEVKPVKILQGQVIVEEGQFITSDIYHQLELVGLLNGGRTPWPAVGLRNLFFDNAEVKRCSLPLDTDPRNVMNAFGQLFLQRFRVVKQKLERTALDSHSFQFAYNLMFCLGGRAFDVNVPNNVGQQKHNGYKNEQTEPKPAVSPRAAPKKRQPGSPDKRKLAFALPGDMAQPFHIAELNKKRCGIPAMFFHVPHGDAVAYTGVDQPFRPLSFRLDSHAAGKRVNPFVFHRFSSSI